MPRRIKIPKEKPSKWATLYVVGHGFAGGIEFGYQWGRWWVWSMAPYLRAIIGITPVEGIGKKLTQKGFEWKWLTKPS